MKWIAELMWLWKVLGIAFLSAAAGAVLVWGVCKASGGSSIGNFPPCNPTALANPGSHLKKIFIQAALHSPAR